MGDREGSEGRERSRAKPVSAGSLLDWSVTVSGSGNWPAFKLARWQPPFGARVVELPEARRFIARRLFGVQVAAPHWGLNL